MNVYCAFLGNTPKWLMAEIPYRMNSDILVTHLITQLKPSQFRTYTEQIDGGYLFFMKI